MFTSPRVGLCNILPSSEPVGPRKVRFYSAVFSLVSFCDTRRYARHIYRCVAIGDCAIETVIVLNSRWRDGLMVIALVSGSSGPSASTGRGHCAVFLGKKTLNSHNASLHRLRCINGYRRS